MIEELGYSERLSELALQARLGWALAGVVLGFFCISLPWLSRRLCSQGNTGGSPRTMRGFLRLLHRSESATASLEFLLVLFPFLFIVMTVWQLAFMFNAQLYVGYAAYAAARSAAVMIPAELNEKKNGNVIKVLEAEGVLNNQGSIGLEKWQRIRRAATFGTLPVSPGDPNVYLQMLLGAKKKAAFNREYSQPRFPDPGSLPARMTLTGLHYGQPDILLRGTRMLRTSAKHAYASSLTAVFINGADERGKDGIGKSVAATARDLSDADTISVKVNYVFWLQVPFVGRMMELAMESPGWRAMLADAAVGSYPSMILSETVTMKSWLRKRATEPCG